MNMLRLRLTIDCQPRTKNGQPPHSTTGAASVSWPHSRAVALRRSTVAEAIISAMARPRSGSVRIPLIQNRRVMSTSSTLGPSSSIDGASGSSAMPHFGQNPGPFWRTSGCIGQV